MQAAAECIARDGMTRVGIAAVAEQAGVSRPTVYRYFESRNDLIVATLVAAGEQFTVDNQRYLLRFRDPAKMAVESAVHVLRALASDKLLSRIWNPSNHDQLDAAIVAAATQPASLDNTRRGLKPLVDAAGWNDVEALEAVEVYTRFIISILLSPDPQRGPDELRAFLRRRLVPALGL
jgi:AcrR family transcriptional regulator